MGRFLRFLRKFLDALYLTGGGIGALFLISILVIIVIQMLARWTGQTFPGGTHYAGYCMASASFFSAAYALNYGAHIRVSLLLEHLGRYRLWGEIWGTGVGLVISGLFSFYAVKTNFLSHKLNDISQGQDATPIWIPQIAMSIGTILLTIALLDRLLRLLFTGESGEKSSALEESEGV
ncbi:MAG: TRAP transporter small permease [Alphaproteobacteria bacterium]